MKIAQQHIVLRDTLRSRIASLAVLSLLLSLGPATAQTLTLANPHWNITLSDAGYSDFLLDNTPGFEGREYLSGEWGAAVCYQLAGGAVVSPQWLEKNFIFPDWTTIPPSRWWRRSPRPG